MGLLVTFLNKFFGNPSSTETRSSEWQHLAWVALYNLLHALFVWLTDLTGNEMAAWQSAAPDMNTTALGLGESAYVMSWGLSRIVHVILPNSLKWLDGHTHQWVDRKYDPQIGALKAGEAWSKNQIEVLDGWRRRYVDPSVASDNNFRRFMQGWPQGILFRWKLWLEHPDLFGQWAAPAILTPLVDQATSRAHRRLLDQLAAAIMDASPDVWRHVERAAVAILETEQ